MDSPNTEERKPVEDSPESKERKPVLDFMEVKGRKTRPVRVALVGVSLPVTNNELSWMVRAPL